MIGRTADGNTARNPMRSCDKCEYFYYGIVDSEGHSDCLNSSSDRFQTYAHWTCDNFYPDTYKNI